MADYVSIDTLRSLDSEPANSTIKEAEPAVRLSGGGVRPLDVVNDTEIDYLVVHQRTGAHNLRYETDFQAYGDLYTYQPASAKADEDFDDRVPLLPLTKHDHVRVISIEDDTEPEPTFTQGDLVGFVDFGNGPRLVPSGYTDSASTTYSEAGAGDFVAFGHVDKVSAVEHKTSFSGHGELIPVRYDDEV